jgi:hypothetical protein
MVMAELTIRLDINPVTNKKDITISYRSDDDALPIEHEEEHRRLVSSLIEGGVLKASEVGTVVIEREEKQGSFELEQEPEPQPEPEKQAIEQKQ